jgi:predicted AAA+ superfamily ATPase
MPHDRKRLALQNLKKKLRFFPVVTIQGARQTGKSFLARKLIRRLYPQSVYLTFDQQSDKERATQHPHSLLAEYVDAKPLIIDEAQKVPIIFETIKFEVDQLREPGRYLLLGSTEFSRLSQVRESLTGRMGKIRLYPMTLHETLDHSSQDPVTRSQVMQYLNKGGMPGIFAIREDEERSALLQDWIDLICLRDIHQFQKLKLNSELAYLILKQCSVLDEPTTPNIAKALRTDPRRINTHLRVLTELFVLQRLDCHPSGRGKPIFLPLDPGVAHFLGASLIRRTHIFLMNERLCSNAYSREKRKVFYYYRSTGKKMIHLVEDSIDSPLRALQVLDAERIKKTDAELMKAFLKKNPGARGEVYAPLPRPQLINDIRFVPWENLPKECSVKLTD